MTSTKTKFCKIEDLVDDDRESKSDFLFKNPIKKSNTIVQAQNNMTSIVTDDQSIFFQLEKEPHHNFTQICQPDQYRKSDKCQICGSNFQQLLNPCKNCQFCGKCVCKDCSKRTRRDPQNPENQVKICDLCHHQILYKRIVTSSMTQKQEKDKLRNELNEECEKTKNELYKIQKINEEIKLQTQTQRLKYGQIIEEQKQKIQEIEDNQNKKISDSSTIKGKIEKLKKEISQQEKELTKLRSTYYELDENKKIYDNMLSEKEEEFVNVQSRYEKIQKDIDKKKFKSQTQDATDLFEQDQKSKSARRYQASIIDYNHITSSCNGNLNSSINQQNKKQVRKDQKINSFNCDKNSCTCF